MKYHGTYRELYWVVIAGTLKVYSYRDLTSPLLEWEIKVMDGKPVEQAAKDLVDQNWERLQNLCDRIDGLQQPLQPPRDIGLGL